MFSVQRINKKKNKTKIQTMEYPPKSHNSKPFHVRSISKDINPLNNFLTAIQLFKQYDSLISIYDGHEWRSKASLKRKAESDARNAECDETTKRMRIEGKLWSRFPIFLYGIRMYDFIEWGFQNKQKQKTLYSLRLQNVPKKKKYMCAYPGVQSLFQYLHFVFFSSSILF